MVGFRVLFKFDVEQVLLIFQLLHLFVIVILGNSQELFTIIVPSHIQHLPQSMRTSKEREHRQIRPLRMRRFSHDCGHSPCQTGTILQNFRASRNKFPTEPRSISRVFCIQTLLPTTMPPSGHCGTSCSREKYLSVHSLRKPPIR